MTVQQLDTARRNGNTNGQAKTNGARTPPHNLQAEESVLGAMLLSRDAVAAVAEIGLQADDFYKPNHGHIHAAITAVSDRGDPPDATTVAAQLQRDGLLETVGGVPALIALIGATPASSNAERYARIVAEHALLRRLIGVAGEIATAGYESGNFDTALEHAEALVYALRDRQGTVDDAVSAKEALSGWLDRLEQRFENGGAISGLPTGFRDLDEILDGLHDGELITVGARPACGKSALGLDLVAHTAAAGHPAVVFSIEMSAAEITGRIMSREARVDGTRLRSGHLVEQDWVRINNRIGPVSEWPFWIHDDPYLTVAQIRARLRRHATRLARAGCRLELVVVDYLQLLTPAQRSENRQVDVTEFADGLKRLAREFDIPVVALAQLSRNLEYRADKRPVLADLRESGSIEQSSNVVLMLYRDELYHPDTDAKGVAEVIVAKQRNGPTGMVRLAWLPQYTTFANMASGRKEPT